MAGRGVGGERENTVLSGAEGRVAQRAPAAAKTERQMLQKAAGGGGAFNCALIFKNIKNRLAA